MDDGQRSEAAVGLLHTGVEADDTFKVEEHGINQIPDTDRHGNPRELFWVWFGANVIFTWVISGSIIVGFGLTFWQALAVVLIGNLFYILLGLGGLAGPKAGTATLAVSRSAFGNLGNAPAALLSWITVVGWEAVNIVIGTFALYQLALLVHVPGGGATKAVCLAIVTVVTFAVALWGHATIVFMAKVFSYALGIGTVVLALYVLPKAHIAHPVGQVGSASLGIWLLAFALIAAGPLSWVNYPADYTRYFPRTASGKAITWWTVLGSAIPTIFICMIGVVAATATNMSDPVGGLQKLVPTWFFSVYLAVIVGGTITNNFLNTYSSGMSLLATGIRLSRVRSILIDAVIGTLMSIYAVFVFDFTNSFIEFLSLMLIWIVPWCAIYLVDMAMRRNSYDGHALHTRGGGAYWYDRGWNWRAIFAFALGILGAGAFANAPLWTGPLVRLVDHGDASIFAGFILAGGSYYLLMRGRIGQPAPAVVVPEAIEATTTAGAVDGS